ncbi:MAG: hypothetical protein COU68_03090 [Candidatus Pacebacteria bacterium CG10_big_fil_rev_8_21_14_0_10_45_6]|nr:MAG: hypothetical protein COU68_03090 [Candidatus Pacebacteria bacterium CG10_big_fil_rev_8_21_14_0_10_45_6]
MKKNKLGFSLIEIMVVTVVFSVVSIITTQSVITSLRGARKTDANNKVRENVDIALSVIERQLHNAHQITSCNSQRIIYTDENGDSATINCNLSAGSLEITSQEITGGSSRRLTSTDIDIDFCSFQCTPANFDQPPEINFSVTAHTIAQDPIEQTPITVSSKIYLRVY